MIHRTLNSADLPDLDLIQAHCYGASMLESADVLASRLQAAPDWIWGIQDGDGLCAYLFTYPTHQGHLAPLNGDFHPSPDGDTLYLHDLAIHPRARGLGLAQQLIQHAWAHAQANGLRHSALISVQDSEPFWAAHGYRTCTELNDRQRACLAGYEQAARYMTRRIDPGA
ncbi:MAG: GNAT family N-acetyltransferase [Castellaniella sp.]|uniref:GNAT family N-acetyltransferase n=1 Tax=Castellaniella sp. TaxID=1955812 RepID=UPI002A3684C3|nr:GNAT family N-acetyltransferase [Castellaniella sp.]MDY0309641.1 GNAT family N-acetyltransferase [Castellaniella sp.]